MNWIPKCAVCVANYVLIEQQRVAVTAKPEAPGQAARAAGLILPGG